MKQYDYMIVGAGLYGAVFAEQAMKKGASVLIIDKRPHIAGNIYTKEERGIQIHRYGAHIFHTSDEKVWNYVNRFARFNHFINSPVANYKGTMYNLPFNMNTFSRLFGICTPAEAKEAIAGEISEAGITEPKNLEETAISLAGKTVYETLVKGYTQKQWGRPCTELPAFIIKRLPLRFTYDNNYFNDRYQGIPEDGYTQMAANMMEGAEIMLNTDFRQYKDSWRKIAGHLVYTGPIDEYFDFRLGHLAFRTLRFEDEWPDTDNYQGNAVVNYTEAEIPYTRIIEHKHFAFGKQPCTVITREYPKEWEAGDEPYYPVNDEKNSALYAEYEALAEEEKDVLFGGRLGTYRYYDMDKVIAKALEDAGRIPEFSRGK